MKNTWNFDNSYTLLPNVFYVRQRPTPVADPDIVIFNQVLAEQLGMPLPANGRDELTQQLAGNIIPNGADPVAQAYAGHQFGHFAMLGDGRAILLGEHVSQHRRYDIQLKGAGITAFSRNGDGRAALGPMLREYIISEAMAALGIPTTRSLAVVRTGEPVYRTQPLTGAVLTRIASSHIRVGTFEYALMRNQLEDLKTLADYTIQRHFAECAEAENPYLALLTEVIQRQAKLVAQWMSVGFIHGVMNTDNMSIAGETIDFGPCAFMNRYDPSTVFSSIDHRGRYAYDQQPRIANWNLLRFAETLLPLIHQEQEQAIAMAVEQLEKFGEYYEAYWLALFSAKLGVQNPVAEDKQLIDALLNIMHQQQSDFTNSFRALAENNLAQAFTQQSDFSAWYQRWQQRLKQQERNLDASLNSMLACNPAVIPRNHLVEEALSAAEDRADLTPLYALLEHIQQPYRKPEQVKYCSPPDNEIGYQTFCGT
jgi:uncharacterized protein YdiU (UPF0061 family)